MDNNPIKYSDLIQPDDSINNLVKQLDEANEAYNNIGNSIKAEAQRIASAMQVISGATQQGRNATKGYSEDAQKLLKAQQDLNFARSETARKIAELNAMKKDEQTITKLTVQLNRAAEGSYEALSAQYALNKIRLNAMTEAERQQTEIGRKLEAETRDLYSRMNELQKATGKYTLEVGNYEKQAANLTKELRQMKMELAEMEANGLRGSDAYNELAQRAGLLQDNIADARAEIKRMSSDTRLLDDAVDIVTTASAAWQTYQGAVQAFGIESEEAMQAMAKLQGIISVTNGIQQLAAKFTNNATATYKVFHAILRLVGLEEKAVAANTVAATAAEQSQTAATEVATAANTANAASITAVNVALKAFKVALVTTGIGAIVVALGTLLEYWDDINEFFGGVSREAKAAAETEKMLADATEESYKEYAKATAQLSVYQHRIETFNGTKKEEKELVDELNSKYGNALGTYKSLDEWKQRLQQSGEAYCKVLQKEAEMTALLSAYQDAYLQKVQAQRKWEEGGYKSWFKTAAGEARDYQRDLDAIDKRMQDIDKRMKTVANEEQSLRTGFNIGSSSSKTTGTKTSKNTKDTSADDARKLQEQLIAIEQKTQQTRIQMIEDAFTRESDLINQNYDNQIAALQARAEKEVALRAALNDQIAALEQKRHFDLANLVTQYAEKAKAEQEKIDNEKKKAAEDAYRTEVDAINKEAQLQQLIIGNMQTSSRQKEELSIQAERERLQKIYDLNVKAGKDLNSLEMRTLQEQIKNADQQLEKAKKPQDMYDVLGLNLDDDKKAAINDSFSFAMDQLNSYMDAWVQAAEKKVALAEKDVENAQNVLNAEREARANGYASNVEYAQKELDLAKNNQQKALREQERAQKAQQAVQTVQQATNLVTASALIWSQLGFPFAIPAIAIMWGSFAAAKIKAAQMASAGNEEYGEGTVELLQGGSHQSGNDVDLGRKKDGTRRRAEGGEFFAVINKRNSRKYRSVIPDVIHAFNSGTFEQKYMDAYKGAGDIQLTDSPTTVELGSLKNDVSAIREQGERRTYTDGRGTHVLYKNLHRVILN